MYETEHNRPIFMACYSVMLYLMFVHEMNKEVEWSSHKSVWKSQVQEKLFSAAHWEAVKHGEKWVSMSHGPQKGKLTDVEDAASAKNHVTINHVSLFAWQPSRMVFPHTLVLSQYTSISLPFQTVFNGGWSSMSLYNEKGLFTIHDQATSWSSVIMLVKCWPLLRFD